MLWALSYASTPVKWSRDSASPPLSDSDQSTEIFSLNLKDFALWKFCQSLEIILTISNWCEPLEKLHLNNQLVTKEFTFNKPQRITSYINVTFEHLCWKHQIEIVTMDTLLLVLCSQWKIFHSSSQHFNYFCANNRIIFWKLHTFPFTLSLKNSFSSLLFHEFGGTLFGKVNYDNSFILMILIFQNKSMDYYYHYS